MFVRFSLLLLCLAVGLSFVACRPSNPSRPTMSFAAPAVASPTAGATYNFSEQPVIIRFANVVRTGGARVTYSVDVSASPSFSSMAFSATDVAEGDGFTSVQLPVLAGGTTYHWRTKAVVDGIEGHASAVSTFFVRPAIALQAPRSVSPTDGAPVFLVRPTFIVENAERSGQPGPLVYEFQVSDSAAFSTLVASGSAGEQTTRTSWTVAEDLPAGTLYWRARAIDHANGISGPFSPAASFDRKGFGAPGDQLDLSAVTVVLGPANIGTWPATGTITNAYARPGEICIEHDKLGAWPGTDFFDDPGTLTQGNQWMFAFINGRWYGGGGRWYRPGQACKGTSPTDGFTGTFYMDNAFPLNGYVPRPGDLVGLMSTTPARFYPSMRTVDERTNVVVVRWRE